MIPAAQLSNEELWAEQEAAARLSKSEIPGGGTGIRWALRQEECLQELMNRIEWVSEKANHCRLEGKA